MGVVADVVARACLDPDRGDGYDFDTELGQFCQERVESRRVVGISTGGKDVKFSAGCIGGLGCIDEIRFDGSKQLFG